MGGSWSRTPQRGWGLNLTGASQLQPAASASWGSSMLGGASTWLSAPLCSAVPPLFPEVSWSYRALPQSATVPADMLFFIVAPGRRGRTPPRRKQSVSRCQARGARARAFPTLPLCRAWGTGAAGRGQTAPGCGGPGHVWPVRGSTTSLGLRLRARRLPGAQ